jgi:hypothetical protein
MLRINPSTVMLTKVSIHSRYVSGGKPRSIARSCQNGLASKDIDNRVTSHIRQLRQWMLNQVQHDDVADARTARQETTA